MEYQYQTRPSTNCMLCLRPTGKLSDEDKCSLQTIADLYFLYLKPKLVTTTVPINWVRVVKGCSFSYCHYCSDCIKAGQKLTALNDRLIALQYEIQALVENLSEEILKYRDEIYPGVKKTVRSIAPNPQHFSDYSATETEIKKEDETIKEEVEIASIYTEEEEYISNQTSVKSQNPLEHYVDSHDNLEDHVDSNDSASGDDEYIHPCIEEQDSIVRKTHGEKKRKNQKGLALERKTTSTKNKKDVIKNIQSRKLLVSLTRLEDRSNRKPDAAKRRKLGKNESEKLLNTGNINKNNSTIPTRARGRKQSFKRLLDEYEVDFDIDDNEIKSLPNDRSNSKKDDFDLDLEDKIDEQASQTMSPKNTSLNLEATHINPESSECSEKFIDLESNSTKLSRTRGKKQSFKHLLDQYEIDFDIDGKEIKSHWNVTSASKNDDPDFKVKKRIDKKESQPFSHEATQCNLECTECSKIFTDVNCFEEHMFIEHKRTVAPCTKCDKIFMDRETRKSHEQSVHTTGQTFSCPACPGLEKIPNMYEFEMHTMTHTGEIPYDCPKCHEKFSNAKNYCEHQKSSVCANSDGQFACAKCNEVFKAKCLLLTHMAVFHKWNMRMSYKLFQCEICKILPMHKFYLEEHYAKEHTEEFIIPCDICGMSLQTLEKFNKHRKLHIGSVAIPCIFCDKTFSKPSLLKCHIKYKHSGKEDTSERICKRCGIKFVGCKKKFYYHNTRCTTGYSCDICGKKFHMLKVFQDHIAFHNEGFPTCKLCNIQFKCKATLRKHVTNVHLKKYSVMCELCGKSLISKNVLKSHMRNKHSDKTENPSCECKICGEKFSNTYKLSTHEDLVHRVEGYSCQYCSEEFPTRSAIKSHVDSKHWEVRNKDFKCTACPAVFKKIKERAKHRLLMHPELVTCNINRQCELCNKVFNTPDALRRHMRRHERDKDGSFQCELCNRTFLKQQSLTWHMTKDHNIKRTKRSSKYSK